MAGNDQDQIVDADGNPVKAPKPAKPTWDKGDQGKPAMPSYEDALAEVDDDDLFADNVMFQFSDALKSEASKYGDLAKYTNKIENNVNALKDELRAQAPTGKDKAPTEPSTPSFNVSAEPVYDEDNNSWSNWEGEFGSWGEWGEWDIAKKEWAPRPENQGLFTPANAAAVVQEAGQQTANIKSKFEQAAIKDSDQENRLKNDYATDLQEVLYYYTEDMKADGKVPINQSDYLNDLGALNEYYTNEINNAKFFENKDKLIAEDNKRSFNPYDFLDKNIENATRGGVKIDLVFGGVGGNLGISHGKGGTLTAANLNGYSLEGIMGVFESNFGNTGGLTDNTSWFRDNWQSTENFYQDNVGNDNERYKKKGNGFGQSYTLDQYGSISGDGDSTFDDLSNVAATYTIQTGRFNNRSWGYSNGTYTNIALTTGKVKYQFTQNYYTSPIVLDMDGDGKLQASGGEWLPGHKLVEGTQIREFDINGDGFVEVIEWAGPNDGLLIEYNGEKNISGNNLFGFAGGWTSGYEKMSWYDKNNDGQLSGEEIAGLSVWQDKNQNAKVDEGEITSLKDAGVTSLNVSHQGFKSTYVQNGETKTTWDWHPLTFNVKRVE